jgi:hypothetical protein
VIAQLYIAVVLAEFTDDLRLVPDAMVIVILLCVPVSLSDFYHGSKLAMYFCMV